MELTLEELKEKISQQWDEVTILEALNINAIQLVEKFQDEIEANFDKLCKEFPLDSDE